MSDKIDIYDDKGKLLESGVDLMDIAPTRNAAIQKIVKDTKRTVAVNLAGIENALASGKMGGAGRRILGRELKYDIVANASACRLCVAKLSGSTKEMTPMYKYLMAESSYVCRFTPFGLQLVQICLQHAQ